MKRCKRKSLAALLTAVLMITGAAAVSPMNTKAEEPVKADYSIHMYGKGWSGQMNDNVPASAGAGSYVTAFRASVKNQPAEMTGTVAYQVNLSGNGWLDWVENMAETGTTETEQPLEAIRMKLTGQLGEQYDIYYKVLQNGGWTEWAKNEETAGQDGVGLRIDGIRVSVVSKGAEAPADAAYGIDPARPMVALTFDDGPGGAVTERILNSLEANGARATFFMLGSRVSSNAAVVQRMASLGCEVGNHTFDHKYITKIGADGIRSQLGATNQHVAAACGVNPVVMRPPGGFYDNSSMAVVAELGMPAIMWTIDTRDWQHKNPAKTVSSVLDNVKDGDIILMHDIYSTTADAAEQLIPELIRRGYQLVTVSELAAYRGGMEAGKVYFKFPPV